MEIYIVRGLGEAPGEAQERVPGVSQGGIVHCVLLVVWCCAVSCGVVSGACGCVLSCVLWIGGEIGCAQAAGHMLLNHHGSMCLLGQTHCTSSKHMENMGGPGSHTPPDWCQSIKCDTFPALLHLCRPTVAVVQCRDSLELQYLREYLGLRYIEF